jgi:YegS/Rv2252/BmrU family lipid kinase
MVKVIASSLRKGNVVEMDGRLYVVLTASNFHPGKGTPTTSVDMRRISDGTKVSERWRTTPPFPPTPWGPSYVGRILPTPDGAHALLYASGSSGVVRPDTSAMQRVELASGRLQPVPATFERFEAASYSVDGDRALLRSSDDRMQLWRVQPWRPLGPLMAARGARYCLPLAQRSEVACVRSGLTAVELLDAGSGATLGVLPVGTMNVFAAELGSPSQLERAWDVIRAGHTRSVDLGQANEQYFVQLAGVGLDAQIVEATTWEAKKSLGPLSYLISAAHVASRKPPRLRVETAEGQYEGAFVLVGNGRYYGGPVTFFNEARLDDGKLDVLIFKNLGYLDLARYLGSVLMRRHTRLPDVEYFQTTEARVHSVDGVPVEVDGEVTGNLPVTFRIAASKLSVLVPG